MNTRIISPKRPGTREPRAGTGGTSGTTVPFADYVKADAPAPGREAPAGRDIGRWVSFADFVEGTARPDAIPGTPGIQDKPDIVSADHESITDSPSFLYNLYMEEFDHHLEYISDHLKVAADRREAFKAAVLRAAEEITRDEPPASPQFGKLPPGMSWPTETYSGSPEARRNGGGIVKYLDRVWLDLIKAGAATRRILADRDPSAIIAINNYCRAHPVTGERKALPERLHFPTLKEVNDEVLAKGVVPIRDAPRLGRAAQRRGLIKTF